MAKQTVKSNCVKEIINHIHPPMLASLCGRVGKSIDIQCAHSRVNAGDPAYPFSVALANQYNACHAFVPNAFASSVRDKRKYKQYQKRYFKYVLDVLEASQRLIGRINYKNTKSAIKEYLKKNY